MRDHILKPATFAVAVAAVVAFCSAAGPALPATASGTPAGRSAITVTAPAAPAAARPVFLATGDQLSAPAAAGTGQPLSVLSSSGGTAVQGQFQVLTLGGQSYVLPAAAVPYLGHGLDPGLFNPRALSSAESGGRLPVRVTYSGHLPALPGVTITSAAGGVAHGYLTAAGAAKLGAALAGQFAADHAAGSYGQDGIFAGGTSIALAAPAATPAKTPDKTPAKTPDKTPAKTHAATQTLTVDGTNLTGKPDTGDYVMVASVDDSNGITPKQAIAVFHDGVATFHVPAGHYWAVGMYDVGFFGASASHVVVLPQFTVAGHTTISVDERTATSVIHVVTARPAQLNAVGLSLSRTATTGPVTGLLWLNGDAKAVTPPLAVTPTQAAPTTGTLTADTSALLLSPHKRPGLPYQYDLAWQSRGTIPPQRFVVNQASLATEHARFYGAVRTTGLVARLPLFPLQRQTINVWADAYETVTPGVLTPSQSQSTVYLSAAPSLQWTESYYPSVWWAGLLGELAAPRALTPGEAFTENWNAYPLHPAPDTMLTTNGGTTYGIQSTLPASADRSGNTLSLYWPAFGDNTPGHTGSLVAGPFTATASYSFDQNGVKLGGGQLPGFGGTFGATATLSPDPAVLRLALHTTLHSRLEPLSTAAQTVWTWRSAHESGSTLPPGWDCEGNIFTNARACAVEPLMTLDYNVVGLGLNGTAPAGQQVVRLTAGHLQLSAATAVTGARVSVSFDGGQTWQRATVTGHGGSYAAVFQAPAGALVTLRATATDAAGGSIAQTISNAYQIAS
jgi:hypothetical protein